MQLHFLETIIADKKMELEFDSYEFSLEYAMCKSFIERNSTISWKTFADIDIVDAAKCLFLVQHKSDKSFEECLDFIDSFALHFVLSDKGQILKEIEFLGTIPCIMNDYNSVKEYLLEKDELKSAMLLKNLLNDNSLFISSFDNCDEEKVSILNLLKMINSYYDVCSFIDVTLNDTAALKSVLSLILEYRQAVLTEKACEECFDSLSLSDKQRNLGMKKSMKKSVDFNMVISLINQIKEYVRVEELKAKNLEKSQKREISNNDQALSLLKNAISNGEIIHADYIVKNIIDEKIKNFFLRFIYQFNLDSYSEISSKHSKLCSSSESDYLIELKKYNISVNKDDIKIIMKNSFSDFKEILDFLNPYIESLGMEKVIFILKNTNIKIINFIKECLNRKFINMNSVIDNCFIFDNGFNFTDKMNNLVNIFNSNGINPQIICENIKLVFSDFEKISENLNILNQYNLLKGIKNISNYDFLFSDNLADKIDKFIELGYYQLIFDDLSLLNSSKVNRLELMHLMNIPIDNINYMNTILNEKNFFVQDSEIDSLISNLSYNSMLDNLDITLDDLNKYLVNEYVYNINGVIVSAKKVARMIKEKKSIKDAIIYNLALSYSEYEEFIACFRKNNL